jgi:hypothetical protein
MKHTQTVASIMLFAGLLLSACGAGKPEPTPTQSLEQIQTAAVVTFAAGLTQTAIRPTRFCQRSRSVRVRQPPWPEGPWRAATSSYMFLM